MNYEDHIVDKEEQDGETVIVSLKISLDQQNQLVEDTLNSIASDPMIAEYSTITPMLPRAVVRTPDDGKAYFKHEEGKTFVHTEMASDDLREAIMRVIGLGEGESETGAAESDQTRDSGTDERQSRTSQREVSADSREVTVTPEFDKSDVDYKQEDEGPHTHWDCKDCVHYVEDSHEDSGMRGMGRCKMVAGEIDPNGHCEDLYADVGFYGRIEEKDFNISLAAWGDMFKTRMSGVHLDKISDAVKEAIRGKM